MALPAAFKKNAEKKKEEGEVREGEKDTDEKKPPFAKKSKGKNKKETKDTEIIEGGAGAEGVTKMNDPRKKGMPSLDDENNDACNKKMDKKGKNCGCEHKNDSLTPQEYVAACKLGIQDRNRIYIRARLDTAERMDKAAATASGKKCGNSYIPKQNTCNAGKGARSYAGGSKDPLSVRRGLIVGASTGSKIGLGIGAVAGAAGGFQKGGITGALTGGVVGALSMGGLGASSGAQYGALIQGGRKTGRALERSFASGKATQTEFSKMKRGANESGQMFNQRAGQTAYNQRTKVWSASGEYMNQSQFKKKKKKDTESVWADGFGKFDAESALSANSMNLATDKYAKEKRKRNAQGQPRNIIYANTFNT